MPKEIIPPGKATRPIGPYSQAVKAGGFVFVSGQIPVVPGTGNVIRDDVAAATRQCIRNIEAVLDDAELTLDDVVSATVFLKDMADFEVMNKVYAEHFSKNPPARATIQVAALPKNSPVEIQVIALAY